MSKYKQQQKNLLIGFIASIVCLVILVSFSIRSVRESLKDEQSIGHSYQVKSAMFQFLSDASDAQSSVRGYFLTQADQDRQNAEASAAKISNDLDQMRSLVTGNPKQVQLLRELEENTAEFRQRMKTAIASFDKDGLQPAIERMKMGRGRQRMSAFKDRLGAIDTEEDRIFSERMKKHKNESAKAEFLILFGGIFFVSLLTLSFLIMRSGFKKIQLYNQQMADKSKVAALGEMAGGIAHEINNPLAVIRANAQLLHTYCKQTEFQPSLFLKSTKKIDETVQRIAQIVSGMLMLARNVKNDHKEAVSLSELIESSVEMCRNRFQATSVELRVINRADSLLIQCRPVELSQVLINLLNNAFDAALEGPKESQAWVELRAEETQGRVKISVMDSGKGIPLVNRSKIMEPFFSTKEGGYGTGLGLSVSKAIVESHGGDLLLNNDIKHTCFEIHLPKGSSSPQIVV